MAGVVQGRSPAHSATVAEVAGDLSVGRRSRPGNRSAPTPGRWRHQSTSATTCIGGARAGAHARPDRAGASGRAHTIGGACTEQAASLALQESFGFERVACFREDGYKFGRWLDVAYMKLLLGQQIDENEAVT